MIKIIDETDSFCKFKQLDPGDLFKLDEIIYMKVVTEDRANAVALDTFSLVCFTGETTVDTVSGELRIY